MMSFKILCVGRLKERFYREAAEEFTKRLSRYGKLTLIEVADEKAPEQLSPALRQQVMKKEGERLLAQLEEGEALIALCIEGKQLSSEALASALADMALAGRSRVAFAIGGSLGLSDEVKARAERRLSFSPMTFSHQIFRVMLLEQLYRACKINAGEPYHK